MPAAHMLQLTPAAPGEQLDARLLRELTAAVRAEPEALRAAFTALQARLRAGDARVRIRATLLADHYFARSKLFRELLAAWLPVRARAANASGVALPLTRSA
jgi:hypothetical protein